MKKILIAAGLGIIVVYFLSTSSDQNETSESYKKSILKAREKKNTFMNSSKESPFISMTDSIIQLRYYDIDELYKVNARIELIEQNRTVSLPSSDGKLVTYRKYAYAKFKLNESDHRLLILKNKQDGKLFTAFADLTSGMESYGAGRYLDLEFDRAKRIIIDFNTAYNPYCNYNDSYSCPLPPRENMLNIEINAGERKY